MQNYFTCNSHAAAGMKSEVLIKSVIEYLCSVTDSNIGPEMYVRHLSVHKPQELLWMWKISDTTGV